MKNETLDGAGKLPKISQKAGKNGIEKIKNEDAVRLGRLGGLKRAQTLDKARRFEIAQNAGRKRWGKDRPNVKFTPLVEPLQ